MLKQITGLEEEVDSGMKLWHMPKFVLALTVGLIGQIATYAPVPYMQPLFKKEYHASKVKRRRQASGSSLAAPAVARLR